MTAPAIPLTTIQGGITRLRVKGAALRNSLFDLTNAYITAGKTIKVRPGTFRRANLAGLNTKGFVAFQGTKHVFCHEEVTVPAGYTLHVLTHPAAGGGAVDIPIKEIHFSAPYMGFLYVVAEFDIPVSVDTNFGDTFHYWTESGGTWQPNTVYQIGDVVTPSAPAGLVFKATRISSPNPVWTANTAHAIGDQVEPTAPNGYFFRVTDTVGATPTSGATEPTWPTTPGATVNEDSEVSGADIQAGIAPQANPNQPSQDVTDRYGNIVGGFR